MVYTNYKSNMDKKIRIKNIREAIDNINKREWFINVPLVITTIKKIKGYDEERDLVRNVLNYLDKEGELSKRGRGEYFGFIKSKYYSPIEQLKDIDLNKYKVSKEVINTIDELNNLDHNTLIRFYNTESIFTTIIENSTITLRNYKDRKGNIEDSEVIEVQNIESIYKLFVDNEIKEYADETFIKNIHSRITSNLENSSRFHGKPGTFVDYQNHISGGFKPCDIELKEEEFKEWIPFFNIKPKDINEALTRLAILHYWFAGIHIFSDANSRTGRFLCSYYLYFHGYSTNMSFGISRAIKDIGGKDEFMYAQADSWDAKDINIYIDWFINELINDQWLKSTKNFIKRH